MRTQGSLTSRFGYDSFGRKRWQAAIELPHEQLSQLNEQKNSLLGHPGHPATLIHRRYEYSKAGELLRQIDKHRGITDYKYDAIGQLRSREPHHPQLGNEDFGYDPAGNLGGSQALSPDNRLKAWKDLRLIYDAWGNVSERHSSNGYQRFTYDCENRLVKAETYRGHDSLSQASYEYDCLGRRIAKHVLTEDKTETTYFLWQSLRMLQEQKADLHSLYIYEQGSYAPLARLDTDPSQPDQKPKRYYFHTDQIGTPLEVTDDSGRMVWRAYYRAWGALEALTPREIEQNLRFQGQYHDIETGLYYNTFRYYDPVIGRFIIQDPISLLGGNNLYVYSPNSNTWTDPLGFLGCELIKSTKNTHDYTLKLDKSVYPETAGHIRDAINAGHPGIVTIQRGLAKSNRAKSLKGYKPHSQLDRDEWPMAMFSEGGNGASVRYIDPSDNRGAGSSIGSILRSLPDGIRVKFEVF